MCLPDFIEFKQVEESNALIGYRTWRNKIGADSILLISESVNYEWNPDNYVGPHEVLDYNSGIYAYNYYNNYYNYYNSYIYNNSYNSYIYNNSYNYDYDYNINGIIKQYGRVAIHKSGQRSEYVKIQTLFTIRESDAKGTDRFLNWIKVFNARVEALAKIYNANTIHWQDFRDPRRERDKQ